MDHTSETAQPTRHLPHEILLAFNNLFRSHLPISTLRETVLSGTLTLSRNVRDEKKPSSSSSTGSFTGRSLLWKLFLLPGSPLIEGKSAVASDCLSELRSARNDYEMLANERLRAPDGTPIGHTRTQRGSGGPANHRGFAKPGGWEKNNPLSLDAENPWQEWFADLELRKVIRQDVERIFPDVSFFSSLEVQESLTDILFVYCITHSEIGYRQGMHELAGTIFMVVDLDSVGDNEVSDVEMREFCSRDHVSGDVYALFSELMKGAARWYEWREPKQHPASGVPQTWLAPIVNVCRRIQDQLLRSVDPALWARLDSVGIEPQMYGIRWLRLLFTREFDLINALIIWDCLLAADPSLDLAEWICVAMLLRIRNKLLSTEDYSTVLTCLLRYPHTTPAGLPLMVKQALLVRENPIPTTGVFVMLQNRDVLGIPIEARPSEAPKRVSAPSEDITRRLNRGSEKTNMSLTELIAKNLMDRADSVALNRLFVSTVTELRKGLPDLSSNISRSFTSQPVPLAAPAGAPPTDTVTQLSQVYEQQQHMGTAMSWALSNLRRIDANPAQVEEAIGVLEAVRDMLMHRDSFDADRLNRATRTSGAPQLAAYHVQSPIVRRNSAKGQGNLTLPSQRSSVVATTLPRVPYPVRSNLPPVDTTYSGAATLTPSAPRQDGKLLSSLAQPAGPATAHVVDNGAPQFPEDDVRTIDPLGVIRR